MAGNDTVEYQNSTNNTEQDIFYGWGVVVPLSILMVAFIILGVVGNIMVILTIMRHRGMRTRTNMFIINLAVADILVAVLDMPVSLITIVKGKWIFGHELCQFNGFTMALFLICSIHTLMYISIHKYISITRPFSRAMTPRRIKMMIAAAWIWSVVCATGPLIGWNHIEFKPGSSQCGPGLPKTMLAITHSLFITTSNYIIPLIVMSFCYSRIFQEIHEHMTRIRETSNIDLESSVSQQKKVSVTLFWVLACFLVCWTPFVIYSTAVAFMKNKENMPAIVNPLAYWCGYMNSACNPIIYAFRSPSFRQGYREIMCGYSSLIRDQSLSFRSRSGRGSTKSNSHFKASVGHFPHRGNQQPEDKRHRPRRMLSQTSWISLPLIPYIIRSMSRSGLSAQRVNRQISENKKSGNAQDTIPEESIRDGKASKTEGCATDDTKSKATKGMQSKTTDLEEQQSFNNSDDDNLTWKERNGESGEHYYEQIELDVIPEDSEGQNASENEMLSGCNRSLENVAREDEKLEDTTLLKLNTVSSSAENDFPIYSKPIKV